MIKVLKVKVNKYYTKNMGTESCPKLSEEKSNSLKVCLARS